MSERLPTKKSKKMLITSVIFLTLLLVFLAVAVFLYLKQSPSVIFKYTAKGNPTGEPEITFLNPLRNRFPERMADKFFNSLVGNGCLDSLSNISNDSKWIQDTCERENKYVLLSRNLINRTDLENKITLYYEGTRLIGREKQKSPIWVEIEKANSDWQIVKYTCFY